MSTNEFKHENFIECSDCHYNANPLESKHCIKCGKSFITASLQNSKKDFQRRFVHSKNDLQSLISLLQFLGWSLLFPFFILIGATYLVMTTITSPKSNSNTEVSSFLNSNQSSFSDIKFYNSMKEVPNVPKGTFNYGGAVTFASLTTQGLYKAINQAHPQFQMRYTEPFNNQPGSSTSISMLIRGELTVAQPTRPLEEEEHSKAREYGLTLQQVPIAIDGLGCYVHPDISIPGLSVNQIRGIYKGKITNWKDVGGPDLPIQFFTVNTTGGSIKTLFGSESEKLSPKVQLPRDFTEAVRKVSSTPGAIGIGSASLIIKQHKIRPLAVARGNSRNFVPLVSNDHQLNQPAFQDGTYPLTRRLFVVIRRDGTPEETAGVAYVNLLLSEEGQQIVEKAGFVPIH